MNSTTKDEDEGEGEGEGEDEAKTGSSWMLTPLFNPAASKQGHHKSYCLDPVEVVTVFNTPSHPE